MESADNSWMSFEEVARTSPGLLDRYLLKAEENRVTKVLLRKRDLSRTSQSLGAVWSDEAK